MSFPYYDMELIRHDTGRPATEMTQATLACQVQFRDGADAQNFQAGHHER